VILSRLVKITRSPCCATNLCTLADQISVDFDWLVDEPLVSLVGAGELE